MSIKGNINELDNINQEIKRISTQLKSLRKRKKLLENTIVEYLNNNEQNGVKYNNNAIFIKKKTKKKQKKKTQQKNDMLNILRQYNIPNPEQVLNQINNAKVEDVEEIDKLHIQKIT